MLEGKSPSHSQRAKFVDHLQRYLPGILLCVAITLAATLLQAIEVKLAGQPYLEALVLAILIGVAIRATWTLDPRWIPGIVFSAKFILEFAIVLLGASVSITMIAALGPLLILGIASIVAVAIGASFLIAALPRSAATDVDSHRLRQFDLR